MFRATAACALLGLLWTQSSGPCPMRGGSAGDVTVEGGHGHAGSRPAAHGHDSGVRPTGEHDHDHDEPQSCRLVMACGTWAPTRPARPPLVGAIMPAGRLPAVADVPYRPAPTPEPPPPRRI